MRKYTCEFCQIILDSMVLVMELKQMLVVESDVWTPLYINSSQVGGEEPQSLSLHLA